MNKDKAAELILVKEKIETVDFATLTTTTLTSIQTKITAWASDLAGTSPALISTTTMAGYTSILNYIKNLPAGTLPTLDEARSQYNQCFAELENFKTAGICLKCDGNASEFYDATDQTYKVKPDNCTKLVQACHKIFAFYSTLNTLNHIFISVNRAIVAKKAGNTTFTPSGLGGGLSLTQLTSLLTCSDDFAKC